jgi:hypothetical protein
MEAFLTKEALIIDENVHALDKVGFFYDELLERQFYHVVR